MVSQRHVVPRGRTKYSSKQLQSMEKLFSISQYPDTNTLEDLADRIDVTTDKVAVWFQNRRSKFKKHSKDGHVIWMRRQIFEKEDCQSHEGDRKNDTTDCHVLSPPIEAKSKPKSNLHYLPNGGLKGMDSGLPAEYSGEIYSNFRGDKRGHITSVGASSSHYFPSTNRASARTSPNMYLDTLSPAAGMLPTSPAGMCNAPLGSWYNPSPASMRTSSPAGWHTPSSRSMLCASRASLNTPPISGCTPSPAGWHTPSTNNMLSASTRSLKTSPIHSSLRISSPAVWHTPSPSDDSLVASHKTPPIPSGVCTPSPDQRSFGHAPAYGNLPQHPLLLCHLLNDMRRQEEARERCTSSTSLHTLTDSDATVHQPLTPYTPSSMYAPLSAYSQPLSPWCFPPTPPYTPGPIPPSRQGQRYTSSSPHLDRV